MVSKTCKNCNAECCRYVAVEIDAPEKKSDFEEIKWFVAHKKVHVYVNDDGEWYVEFATRCKYLGKDNKCKNYEHRPKICRKYNQDECTFHNGSPEVYIFKSIKDVEKYMKEKFQKKK